MRTRCGTCSARSSRRRTARGGARGRRAGGGRRVGEDAEDAARWVARALRAEVELERVQAASKEQLETMEREVELTEMMQEMKKNAGAR